LGEDAALEADLDVVLLALLGQFDGDGLHLLPVLALAGAEVDEKGPGSQVVGELNVALLALLSLGLLESCPGGCLCAVSSWLRMCSDKTMIWASPTLRP
jgi:hypothetical protein